MLEELRLVQRFEVARGTASYERIDPSGHHHHHAICRRCGRMEDVEAPVDLRAAEAAAAKAGFRADHGELQLSGLCAACAG